MPIHGRLGASTRLGLLPNPWLFGAQGPRPVHCTEFTHPSEVSLEFSLVLTRISVPFPQGYQGMVDGGRNIVEANWESVSSILQVVRADFQNSVSLK